MFKSNTFVFLVCLAFLLVLFCFIYQDFRKRLTLLSSSKSHTNGTNNGLFNTSEKIEEKENQEPCHSFGKMRWVHHTETGECYEIGTVGPCGPSMTFYKHQRSNIEGFCDCDDIVEVKSDIAGCDSVERPLVWYPEHDRCYTVFSQGPCGQDEWLVLNEFYTPNCEKNICLNASSKDKNSEEDEFSLKFWTSHKKKCYKTLTRAYCDKGLQLKVTKNNWKPECHKEMVGCPPSISVSIPILTCRAGSKLHQMGLCFLR